MISRTHFTPSGSPQIGANINVSTMQHNTCSEYVNPKSKLEVTFF